MRVTVLHTTTSLHIVQTTLENNMVRAYDKCIPLEDTRTVKLKFPEAFHLHEGSSQSSRTLITDAVPWKNNDKKKRCICAFQTTFGRPLDFW